MGKKTLQTVAKALRVLEALVDHHEVSLTELSEELSIPPSTLYRLLASLSEGGFARQSPETSKYYVGEKFLSLAVSALQQMDIQEVSYPYLNDLMEDTGETANLVILDSNLREVVYIQQVESQATVRGFSLIGSRAPSYATGVGKVLLASRDWEEVASSFDGSNLEKLTENTITDLSKLRSELERVERQGYGLDREECEKGAACIAAPVYNSCDEAVAAVSISGPTSRLLDGSEDDLIDSLRGHADRLSEALKYQLQDRLPLTV